MTFRFWTRCQFCAGHGWIYNQQDGIREWLACPACVTPERRCEYGPATIRTHFRDDASYCESGLPSTLPRNIDALAKEKAEHQIGSLSYVE